MSMDGPLAANSGHQGTGMALAPLGHTLYSRVMKHDPADPLWPDRDRFVLSGGHVSILQYSMLFLSGYGLELDDLKQFRQWDSLTPGHPEVVTPPASKSPQAHSAKALPMPSAWRLPKPICGPVSVPRR